MMNMIFMIRKAAKRPGKDPIMRLVTMLRMTIMIVTMILIPCLMAVSRK